MIRHRGLPPAHAGIPNLAPMVDVVMVILIFFMLGTTFAVNEGALPTQLPSQIGPGGAAQVSIIPVISIALTQNADPGDCRIIVMEETQLASFVELRAFLNERMQAGAEPGSPILIGAEPEVAYRHVISAMDACVQAGFGNIQFSIAPAAGEQGE